MKTTKLPETKLRKFLATQMDTFWQMTWHEDREITPGVPDLHYVMKGGDHRVGWLELKAIDTNLTKTQKISVEPSQHQYLRRWGSVMPIHFLVRVLDHVYVIPSIYAKELNNATNETELMAMSSIHFYQRDMMKVLPAFLSGVTKV